MKTNKKILIFIMMLVCFLFLVACNTPQKVSPITRPVVSLNWSIETRPRVFYPSMTLSDVEKQMVNHLYEGLTRTDNDLVSKGIASIINVSEDRLRYHITLKNAQWSDGQMVKVDDFIYSWERAANYSGDLNLLYFDSYIDYVEEVNDLEMVIHLKIPNDDLLKRLSTVEFMPLRRDLIDLDLPTPILLSDVTNGPFILKNYDFVGGITLQRNIHYHDYYAIKVGQINVEFRSDNLKVYREFKEDRFDIVQNIHMREYDDLLQNDDEFYIFKKPGVYSFAINHEIPELRDVKIRRALNLAIDRSEINPYEDILLNSISYSIFNDEVVDNLRVLSSNGFDYIKLVNSPKPDKPYVDIDRLNKLLDQIDPTVVNNLDSLIITTTNSPNDIRVANLIKENWIENLGVSVRVEPKDRYDFEYIKRSKTYDFILDTRYYTSQEPRYLLKYFISNTAVNQSVYVSETFDTMMKNVDFKDDIATYRQFQNAIADIENISLWIPLFKTSDPVLISENLLGWSRSYEGLFNLGRVHRKEDEREDRKTE